MDLISRPEMGHIMNALRLLSVVGVFVMASFPSVGLSDIADDAFSFTACFRA